MIARAVLRGGGDREAAGPRTARAARSPDRDRGAAARRARRAPRRRAHRDVRAVLRGLRRHHGARAVRGELCDEAIRMAGAVAAHPATDRPHVHALLALMLLHASRLAARFDAAGALVSLEHQDRSRWTTRSSPRIRAPRALRRRGRGQPVPLRGGHRRLPRRRPVVRRDRLGPDRRVLRSPGRDRRLAGGQRQPRDRGRTRRGAEAGLRELRRFLERRLAELA